MRTILILKRIINVFYYLYILGFAIEAIRLMFYVLLSNIENLKPKFLNDMTDFTDSTGVITVASHIISLLLIYIFILIIEQLKQAAIDLINENYFNNLVISSFKKAGVLLLIFTGIKFIAKIIFPLLFESTFKITDGNFPVFFVLIGLFLIFLSEVFDKARKTQQENDLTI